VRPELERRPTGKGVGIIFMEWGLQTKWSHRLRVAVYAQRRELLAAPSDVAAGLRVQILGAVLQRGRGRKRTYRRTWGNFEWIRMHRAAVDPLQSLG
jgi:hypothetical protein